MYGRKPVYMFTSVALTAIVVGIGNQKAIGDLYAQQVLSGLAGATSETLIQLTVSHRDVLTNAIFISPNVLRH